MPLFPTRLEREPFASRRRRLIEARPDAVLVVRGVGPEGLNPALWYLTGVAESSATLVLSGRPMRYGVGGRYPGPNYVDGSPTRQLLFLPSSDPFAERWGEQAQALAGAVDAADLGVDAVASVGELPAALGVILRDAERVEIVRGFVPRLDGDDDPDTRFARTIRDRFTHLTIGDATASLHEMRRLKDADERAAIRRAAELVGRALERLLARMRPGVGESELEAELTRTYREAGAVHSFDPIVAAGPHALQLHYVRNDGHLTDGDLLLVDTGAQLDGYCADISRTFPLGGVFSSRQRELYDLVLRAEQETIAATRPGVTLGDLHRVAYGVVDGAGHGDRFVHGLGHHLGLETHDVGDTRRPLDEGAVITVEPGVYLQDESIGIRIEDDVAVVRDGRDVLSDSIPSGAAEVEAWIARARGGAG